MLAMTLLLLGWLLFNVGNALGTVRGCRCPTTAGDVTT